MKQTLYSRTLNISLLTLSLFVFLFAFGVPGVSAQTPQYTPLVGLPGLEGQGKSLADYFNQLYLLTIVVGCFIAVLKITMAGVKWALTEIVTEKSDAREDIKGALLGLAILLVPFIVLNTINPNLTNLNILRNAGSVRPNMNTPSQSTIQSQSTTNQAVDPVAQKSAASKQACTDQNKKNDGYTYAYDDSSQTCKRTEIKVTEQTYKREEITNELNAEWQAKCGDKLRVVTNSDGSRTYSCAQ